MPLRSTRMRLRGLGFALGILGTLVGSGSQARTAPERPAVVMVWGDVADGRLLASAADGVALAAQGSPPLTVVLLETDGTEAGHRTALRRMRQAHPLCVLVVGGEAGASYVWKAARTTDVPFLVLAGLGPDLTHNEGNVFHLGPPAATEAVFAADALLAPLAARRVAVVADAGSRSRALAEGLARNLSDWIRLAGVETWPEDVDDIEEAADRVVRGLRALEVDWTYVALRGARAEALVRAQERAGEVRRFLFADGNRSASLLAHAPTNLEGSTFVDLPDPELTGRAGERFVRGLEEHARPNDSMAARAYEAVRRVREAVQASGSTRGAKVAAALRDGGTSGLLGPIELAPHGGAKRHPCVLWVAHAGSLAPWIEARAPTGGCGPPLGFGRPIPEGPSEGRGRVGWLTFGEGDARTIQRDLERIGLSTKGLDSELDRAIEREVLGRAIRIAYRLFRREADGTAIPGWSWGMTFTVDPPEPDLPRHRVWHALIAGDHEAAGGQVIGDGRVAVYSTFLVRTLYEHHALDPPIGAADRPFLDGTWRWSQDGGERRRADEIRCLLDGFASAIALTLTHEFGHLCGCGHDTEHPTSIMNVVQGAGAAWTDAVWIPTHALLVDRALGLEGVR